MTLGYREAASGFFLEYVNARGRGFNDDGNLTDEALKAATELLLEKQMFASFDEMKLEALKNWNVILPDWLGELEGVPNHD